MRIKTPINKETISQHMHYSRWKYFLILAAALVGWGVLYTVTAYRSPQDKRIDLYVMSNTSSTEMVDQFIEPIWKETVPETETVHSVILVLADEAATDQQLTVYAIAADMDIVFFPEQYFKRFATQGFFLPLDDLAADGTIDVSGLDLARGYMTMVEEYDDQDRPVKTARHLYGIPLDSFYGFVQGMNLDSRDMYAAIMVNNYNDDNVIPFFNALLQAGRGDMESLTAEAQGAAAE